MTRDSLAIALLIILTYTGTQCKGSNQSQHTTHTVYNGRAGEIVEYVAKGGHHKTVGCIVAEPATTPGPVALDGVDEQ